MKYLLNFIASRIFTVTSTGPDSVSDIVYGTVGNVPAPTYFSIDNSGQVRVQTDLTQDNTVEYYVSCCASLVICRVRGYAIG